MSLVVREALPDTRELRENCGDVDRIRLLCMNSINVTVIFTVISVEPIHVILNWPALLKK
jgi:hypothetical protein